MSRLFRRACALLGALAVAAAALAATAPAASAHAALLFTSPAVGSAVPVPPQRIVLTFDEPVTLAINNSMCHLRGYPHGCEEDWPHYISASDEEVERVFSEWRHLMGWGVDRAASE